MLSVFPTHVTLGIESSDKHRSERKADRSRNGTAPVWRGEFARFARSGPIVPRCILDENNTFHLKFTE